MDDAPLPDVLSPCHNVRRSCEAFLVSERKRLVEIDMEKLRELAVQISRQIVTRQTNFAEWDASDCHYTASSYVRPHLSPRELSSQRRERIALYVLCLDTLNFCFWPHTSSSVQKNKFQYHHLAIALKHVAETDDIIILPSSSTKEEEELNNNNNVERCDDDVDKSVVMVEESYAFSPKKLSMLTLEGFIALLTPHLPPDTNLTEDDGSVGQYSLLNMRERTRLLNELGHALTLLHSRSVTCLIAKANGRADTLVYLLLQTCSGFRDECVCDGRLVYFYKRAQIAVADLWAALGNDDDDGRNFFVDIEKITTFADYRVPQLLRHVGVFRYAPSLAYAIEEHPMEIAAGSREELYIRASTVVAVERLVTLVKELLATDHRALQENVCAVKIDWHLWQAGEELEQGEQMKRHHLTRTIYY